MLLINFYSPSPDQDKTKHQINVTLFRWSFCMRWFRHIKAEWALALDLKGLYVTQGYSTVCYCWLGKNMKKSQEKKVATMIMSDLTDELPLLKQK